MGAASVIYPDLFFVRSTSVHQRPIIYHSGVNIENNVCRRAAKPSAQGVMVVHLE